MRRTGFSLVTVAACAGSIPVAPSQPRDEAVHEVASAATWANRLVDEQWLVGLAVAELDGDETRVATYGRAREADDHPPSATDTLFEIGSVTKTFTALLLAQELVAGRLQETTSLGELFPQDERFGASAAVTLGELATHRSGLPRLPPDFAPTNPANPYAEYTDERLLSALVDLELTPSPFVYSNWGVSLLGYALAQRAEKPYAALLHQRVLGPLGMEHTVLAGESLPDATHLAEGHADVTTPVPAWDLAAFAPAGGVRATLQDMVSYTRAHMGAAPESLASAIDEATREHHDPGGEFAVGLAWLRMSEPEVVWHDGQTGGSSSFVAFSRSASKAVIVLSNTANSVLVRRYGMAVLEGLLGRPTSFDLPPSVQVAPETLQGYVGDYQLAPEVVMSIRREGAQLFVQVTGQPRFRLYAKSETEFYTRVVEAGGIFTVDETGRATKLTWLQGGARIEAPRIAAPE